MVMEILIILLGIATCVTVGFVAGWITRAEHEREKRRRPPHYLPHDARHARRRY